VPNSGELTEKRAHAVCSKGAISMFTCRTGKLRKTHAGSLWVQFLICFTWPNKASLEKENNPGDEEEPLETWFTLWADQAA